MRWIISLRSEIFEDAPGDMGRDMLANEEQSSCERLRAVTQCRNHHLTLLPLSLSDLSMILSVFEGDFRSLPY